jgi:hypothetical protein
MGSLALAYRGLATVAQALRKFQSLAKNLLARFSRSSLCSRRRSECLSPGVDDEFRVLYRAVQQFGLLHRHVGVVSPGRDQQRRAARAPSHDRLVAALISTLLEVLRSSA